MKRTAKKPLDSLRLAAAVSALSRPVTRLRYADNNARACYHYGCLLRRCGSYPEAMQAFLSATHSRTTDYVTLGRVYSNMGSMCHLEGDYQLSYAQFEKSAASFFPCGGQHRLLLCLERHGIRVGGAEIEG